MEQKAGLPFYKEGILEGMGIVDSDQPPHLKRRHLWELADSVKSQVYNTYVDDLRRLKAV